MKIFKLKNLLLSVAMYYWTGSNSNIESLATCQNINLIGFSANNIAKVIEYQIIGNTLVLKVK